MDVEVVNDWGDKRRLASKPGRRGQQLAPPSPDDIGEKLADFEPAILNLHCYEDVGYPWVHVVFNEHIGPDVALRLGRTLIGLAGKGKVYLNSLRPRSVYFLLEPAFDPKPDLEASRYGEVLESIADVWTRENNKKSK